MAKEFKFNIGNKSAKEIINKTKNIIEKKCGSIGGYDNKGHFQILGTKGYYSIKDKSITINVVSKPMLVPWKTIERKLKDYFS